MVETELTDELPTGVEVGQEVAVLYDPLRSQEAQLQPPARS